MKRALLLAAALAVATAGQAQSYWQQHTDTKISVTLDDRKHMLHGFEEFHYSNNSPDTLHYIYIHLWPNAYEHDHTAFAEQQYRNGHTSFYYAPEEDRGYIDSLDFTINGKNVNYLSTDATPDIARIDLPSPLAPGASMIVATPFRVKIPKVFSRLGHSGQAYFISQWFPKPAVYDRKGWHPIPYLDLGEFYSEIGSYEVAVTVPKNYVVMGTGNIEDAEENLWLEEKAKEKAPADSSRNKAMPASASEMKTIHFKEDNIHDFAWFADKRWTVRKDTVTIPGNPEPITAWAAYLPGYDKSWKKGTDHLKNTVKYYSKWVGPYPYKTIKAVQGDMKAGGGMEYPTITIIDRSMGGSQTVIVHEGGHNWFYGMLATNERDHGWMDEGVNSFYEQKTMDAISNGVNNGAVSNIRNLSKAENDLTVTVYEQLAASHEDQAIDQTSNNFKEINYGLDVYYKTAIMLGWLEDYMGQDKFEEAMHDYFDTWKFRHPYPEDFKAIFTKHTDKPLDWFFDDIMNMDEPIDFKLKGVAGNEVIVKNKTDLKIPAKVNVYNGDSIVNSLWSEPFTGTIRLKLPENSGSWTSVKIDPIIPDVKTVNNRYRRYGIHRFPFKPAAFVGRNNDNSSKIWISPAVGYNMYDGFMGGLLFHNLTWPENKFKYILTPMYGFRSKSFAGAGSIGYSFNPKTTFDEIMLQADMKSFSFNENDMNVPDPLFRRYAKVAPSITFTFKKPSFISPVERTLTFKGYYIAEGQFKFQQVPGDTSGTEFFPSKDGMSEHIYGLLRYEHKNDRTFNPFSYRFEGEIGADFADISLEGNIRIDYHVKKKSLYVRAYAGKFFEFNPNSPDLDRYTLNMTTTGSDDFLYDETYLGRTEREGFGARQITIQEGGFKIPTPLYSNPIGQSDNWLAAINLKTDLPLGKLPLRLFLDAGTFADAAKINPSGNKILFDAGLEFYISDVFNIYFPLFMSQDYQDYMKSIHGKDRFIKGITFSLQLQNINWLKASRGVFKLFGM
jgi:hypothetical protein